MNKIIPSLFLAALLGQSLFTTVALANTEAAQVEEAEGEEKEEPKAE